MPVYYDLYPEDQEADFSLTRLIRVAILCSTCRLNNESAVSTFKSDARANLRLKLAVASVWESCLIGGCWLFSPAMLYKWIWGWSVRV
jgi:hypothetical protein